MPEGCSIRAYLSGLRSVKLKAMKSVEDVRGRKQWLEMGGKNDCAHCLKHYNSYISNSKVYPNTCRDINAFRRHTRSRQLRLISTPRLGKLSAHTIITSDSQMTWIHRTHNYLNIALQTLHYHSMSAWSTIQPYRNVINSINMYRCILTWTICLWWWSGQWVS